MRRSLRVIALAAVLAGSFGFVSVEAPQDEDVVVCVKFQDTVVPVTGTTVPRPTERVCVKTPDLNVPWGGR